MAGKVKSNPTNNKEESKESFTQIVIPCKTEDKKYIVCEVCGYANPENASMCEMCSNYLILGRCD